MEVVHADAPRSDDQEPQDGSSLCDRARDGPPDAGREGGVVAGGTWRAEHRTPKTKPWGPGAPCPFRSKGGFRRVSCVYFAISWPMCQSSSRMSLSIARRAAFPERGIEITIVISIPGSEKAALLAMDK